jgi:hypothetical protein
MSGYAAEVVNGLPLTGQVMLSDPLSKGGRCGVASRRESWPPASIRGKSRKLRNYIHNSGGSSKRHQVILVAQEHGQSLFLHGINAQRQILQETESADSRVDERARKALPIVRDLLQETTEGLRRLASIAPVEHPDGMATLEVPDLSQIDWPSLLGHSKEFDNPLVQRAIEDFDAALHSPLIFSPTSIDEVCSRLDRMYRDVGVLIEAQPDERSAVTILQILRIAARLAIAVAIGLLATAASTATAGGDVASSLLPAAVAVVVTSLCDRLGKVITVSQMPTVGELLKTDHDELVSMLQDLAAFIDPRRRTPRVRHLGVEPIGDIIAVAEVTAQHAKILAKKVSWLPADFYVTQLDVVCELLTKTNNVKGASGFDRSQLAGQLWQAFYKLSGWKIPADLRESTGASYPASISSPAEPDSPPTAKEPTPCPAPLNDSADRAGTPADSLAELLKSKDFRNLASNTDTVDATKPSRAIDDISSLG